MEVTPYGTVCVAVGEETVTVEYDGDTGADSLGAFVETCPETEDSRYDGDDSLQQNV